MPTGGGSLLSTLFFLILILLFLEVIGLDEEQTCASVHPSLRPLLGVGRGSRPAVAGREVTQSGVRVLTSVDKRNPGHFLPSLLPKHHYYHPDFTHRWYREVIYHVFGDP